MIGIGIIGCGTIANRRHAPEYQENPDAQIIGCYDYSVEKASQLAKQYGCRTYGTIEEMLAETAIEAVSVCTPNKFHAAHTIAALGAGKHALCEKPMATSAIEAEKMLKAEKASGKFLMIGYNQRYAQAHRKVKDILSDTEMGRVLSFRTTFGHGGPEEWTNSSDRSSWFFKKDGARFGVLGDLGVHKIDIIRWLLGDEVEEVKAFTATLDKKTKEGEWIDVDDNAVILLRFKKGTIGTVSVSWTHYGTEDNSTILYCENGIIRIYDHPDFPIRLIRKNREEVLYKTGGIQTNAEQSNSGVIDAFIDTILLDQKPISSGKDGLMAVKIIEACYQSSSIGKSVIVS